MIDLRIKRLDTNEELICQFLPETINTGRTTELIQTSPPSSSYPRQYFSRGNIREKTFKLYFDSTRIDANGIKPDIIKIDKFINSLQGTENSSVFFDSIPRCLVACGDFHTFTGYLISCTPEVLLYDPNYIPQVISYELKWVVIK